MTTPNKEPKKIKLPSRKQGVVISISLESLPMYLMVNGLNPTQWKNGESLLIVKRCEDEKEIVK